jgi:hypothetical protein
MYNSSMPAISQFFGIFIRMFFNEHLVCCHQGIWPLGPELTDSGILFFVIAAFPLSEYQEISRGPGYGRKAVRCSPCIPAQAAPQAGVPGLHPQPFAFFLYRQKI